MQRHVRRLTSAFTVTVLAILATGLCLGGKPAPPPPPTGTIYFTETDYSVTTVPSVLAMNPDGSGKSAALPAETITSGRAEPSALKYGGEPVWLVRGDELVALTRRADGSVNSLQVTQFSPDIFGLRDIRWANSGLDEFLSFKALAVDEAGVPWACIFRLNVSGLEIAGALDAGGEGWTPFGPADPRLELVHCVPFSQGSPNPNGTDGLNIVAHDWSPDGTKLAYVLMEYDPDQGASAYSLIVRDLAAATEKVVLGGQFYDSVFTPRWSPDGNSIVAEGWLWVTTRKSSKFVTGIWSVAPDGSDAKLLVPDPQNGHLGLASWSPDGRFLAVERVVQESGTLRDKYDVIRVNADGSGTTVLTGDRNPYAAKVLLDWR